MLPNVEELYPSKLGNLWSTICRFIACIHTHHKIHSISLNLIHNYNVILVMNLVILSLHLKNPTMENTLTRALAISVFQANAPVTSLPLNSLSSTTFVQQASLHEPM